MFWLESKPKGMHLNRNVVKFSGGVRAQNIDSIRDCKGE